MNDYQILLLPKKGYYRWVAASSAYVQHYGANLTADLGTAGRYMHPNQVVTIVISPDGYGRDIEAWFRQNHAGARLDVIRAATPQDLDNTLATRLSSADRYGKAGQRFVLRWPTNYLKITQSFGANADVYRRWGLPGHEGLDIRAPLNSNIYACASGTVYRVHDGSRNHPYGIHVRLQHRDGYRTIYSHLSKPPGDRGREAGRLPDRASLLGICRMASRIQLVHRVDHSHSRETEAMALDQ